MYGWLLVSGAEIGCFEKDKIVCREEYTFYDNTLKKFPDDHVKCSQNGKEYFLEGYIHNKNEIMYAYSQNTWEKGYCSHYEDKRSFVELRGAFSGYVFDREKNSYVVFADQIGNHAVYYYHKDKVFIAASRVDFIVRVLKHNGIMYHLDTNAIECMTSYGFMLDSTTFVQEIKRLIPGCLINRTSTVLSEIRYYTISNRSEQNMTEEEAVERIDRAFRTAVQRELEKDKEYGYQYLIDLSGGLDSRMVSWVADDLGYKEQLNFTYCRSGYLDYVISQKIARYLHHDYLYYPLDSANWMLDIEENVKGNNGVDCFINITGGNRVLKNINTDKFGIEHTGMLGDVIIGSYFSEEKLNYGKPELGYHQYSDKRVPQIDRAILEQYDNLEEFTIATRGFLGVQASYFLRQQYVETASPFCDVDFLNVCLSIPFHFRTKHKIYLKWIEKKYPNAAEFGWEKWKGIKPKKKCIKYRKMHTGLVLARQMVNTLLGRANVDNMNPIDYWYEKNSKIRRTYQEYYEEHINNEVIPDDYQAQLKDMFENGNVTEKCMVLTVLAAVNIWF